MRRTLLRLRLKEIVLLAMGLGRNPDAAHGPAGPEGPETRPHFKTQTA